MAEQEKNNVRQEMLAAIRRQLVASLPHDAVRKEHASHLHPRPMITTADENGTNLSPVDRFSAALKAVAGHCTLVRDEVQAAGIVQEIIDKTAARRIAVSDSTLVRRVIEKMDTEVEMLANASAAALFDCDIGITGAQWAVAETGTLVLESERERHRLVSLVPAVHIAIISAQRVRQTLSEVLAAINENGREALSRTVTFITGPSRTSDIELTLAIGVHGPAELYVIIIEGLNE